MKVYITGFETTKGGAGWVWRYKESDRDLCFADILKDVPNFNDTGMIYKGEIEIGYLKDSEEITIFIGEYLQLCDFDKGFKDVVSF